MKTSSKDMGKFQNWPYEERLQMIDESLVRLETDKEEKSQEISLEVYAGNEEGRRRLNRRMIEISNEIDDLRKLRTQTTRKMREEKRRAD